MIASLSTRLHSFEQTVVDAKEAKYVKEPETETKVEMHVDNRALIEGEQTNTTQVDEEVKTDDQNISGIETETVDVIDQMMSEE